MKSISTITVLLFTVLAMGCSSISVNYDWDQDVNFEYYRTFAWMPQQTGTAGDARKARMSNTLLEKRIRNAVNAELTKKGMRLDTENPDLVLVYHTGTQDKVNVTDWGYTYGDHYWGYGGRQIDVYNYTEGTLIVDLIDYSTKELVFRTSATAVIDKNPTPEQSEKNVNNAVAKMFSKYPPK